jgi:ATP-binding cassette, subfamily C, bacterial LapB
MPPALRLAVPNAWQIPPGTASLDDPLLGCLQILCRIHARDVAPDTLTAGLPLVEHRLTPDLFTRAAERGGLGSKIVHRTIEKLSELVLPAVLLLEDKKACVLVRKSGNIKATIVLPETGQGEHEVTLKHLAQMYTGYAILARPRFQFDDRTAESTMPRTRHWFWSALSGSWRIYGEVLIASFLVNLFALAMPLFTMNVYDRVVPSRAIETLWVLAIGVGIVLLFDLGMRALRGYFVDLAGKKIDVVLSTQIHERVLGLQMAARPKSVGAFASSVQEFEAVREFITSVTITTIIDLPFALLFIAVIAWLAGPLAWICVAAVPVVILASLAVQRPLGRAVEANIRLNAQRQASLIETLVGLDTIKIMRAEGQRQRRWEQVIAQIATHALKSRFLSATAVNFSPFMQQLAYLAIVISGVYLIAR